jgi:hypothetical protein
MKNKEAQAKAKVEFRIHLIIYIAVITLLAIINLLATPGYIWFKWPLLGWGIAIVIHALIVYFSSGNRDSKSE